MAIHATYNSNLLPPAVSAAAVLVTVPALVVIAMARGETALRSWLGDGFDGETELLAVVTGGAFLETRAGAYLKSLKSRFPPAAAADMLCLVRAFHSRQSGTVEARSRIRVLTGCRRGGKIERAGVPGT